eukprot:408482-Rhodomonas_salina.4
MTLWSSYAEHTTTNFETRSVSKSPLPNLPTARRDSGKPSAFAFAVRIVMAARPLTRANYELEDDVPVRRRVSFAAESERGGAEGGGASRTEHPDDTSQHQRCVSTPTLSPRPGSDSELRVAALSTPLFDTPFSLRAFEQWSPGRNRCIRPLTCSPALSFRTCKI